MNSRIKQTFEKLERQNKKALIPFIMPGVPSLAGTQDIILRLEKRGSDLIEIGIPFSDPVADGPVIQKAADIALKKGIHTKQIFEMVSKIRRKLTIPVILLVYYNCVFRCGTDSFVQQCVESGVDGLIIPDLPFEEREEIDKVIGDLPLDVITLTAPTSGRRLKKILQPARGFVYCISRTGVTGERDTLPAHLANFLREVRKYTSLPRAVGFGISNSEQVRYIKDHCEGIITGSTLLRRLLNEGMEAALDFISGLRAALDEVPDSFISL